jgi:hypothetical protein
MTKLTLASLAVGALMLVTGIPAARADTLRADNFCTKTLTGAIFGNVVVPRGTCTLGFPSGPPATVTGNVIVEPGASLVVQGGSTVAGNISADQCGAVDISPFATTGTNSVYGNVSIQNCTGNLNGYGGSQPPFTRINGNFLCEGNATGCHAVGGSVGGNMQFDNTGGAVVEGNSVGGNVQFDGNSGTVTVLSNSVGGNMQVNSNGGAEVEDNTIIGNLVCQSNGSLRVSGNTVLGTTQCP